MSTSARVRRERGLSLIELLMFMVIIGIALAAVLQAMNWTSQRSGEPLKDRQALLIAEALLEEVSMARFTYCDPTDANAEEAASTANCASIVENVGRTGAEPVGARPFDNVNDYVTAFKTPQASFNDASGVLVDAHDVPFPAGYTATVEISATDALGGITSAAAPASTEVLLITIRVQSDATAVRLDGYRTRFAPNAL